MRHFIVNSIDRAILQSFLDRLKSTLLFVVHDNCNLEFFCELSQCRFDARPQNQLFVKCFSWIGVWMTYESAYYTVKHYDQQISNHRFSRWLRRFLFYFLRLFLSLILCWLLFLSLSKNLSSSEFFAAFIHVCIKDAIGLV